MSRYTGPTTKIKRKFGMLPESPSDTKKVYKKRRSDYAIQLEEKQKLRFIYGIQEKQFRKYYQIAQRNPENTGHVLLQQLERRLDNVIYRLRFATTRDAARQLVNHGHVLVDGKKVDIPSFMVKEKQVITLKVSSLEIPNVKESLDDSKDDQIAPWLVRNKVAGMVKSLPGSDHLREDIDIQLIIEYYSR